METQEQDQGSTSAQTHDLDYVYMGNESSWCRIRLHGTEILTSDYETVAYHLADGRVAVLAENPEDTSTSRLHIHDGDEPLRDWLLQWFERGDVQEIAIGGEDDDRTAVTDAICVDCMTDVERDRVVEMSELVIDQTDERIAYAERMLEAGDG